MEINEKVYLSRYEALNDQQKEAVDTVFGPVMVVAGPGTGKTEVLSVRIANLLRSDVQVQPNEILCLTYTDEATNSMRKRLVQIIGPEAHRINIFTFHAFCNQIIQNNSGYFNFYSNFTFQTISDLEKIELLYKIIEDLKPGHPLRRLSGHIYTDAPKLGKLFEVMKKEYYSPETISTYIDIYLDSLPQREEYIYKRATKEFKKGDLKQVLIDAEVKRMESTRAAAFLFEKYQTAMKVAGRYDFNDMLIWVLDAFKEYPALLQSYQERYQFILVDEFQDTNGSQNELLQTLASYWEDPNIFVVGDDDQGIYEFQGARIKNIIDFYMRYKENIKAIVLPQNYRSSQAILDKAMATIKNNQQRLVTQITDIKLDKNIIASSHRFKEGKNNIQPEIIVYETVLQEETDIVLQINELKDAGVSLKEIAVLYAQHKQADNIMAVMERKGIPFNAKKSINILHEPLIEQLLKTLRYLDAEGKKSFDGENELFVLLHTPYFCINSIDIAQLALLLQTLAQEKKPIKWKILLSQPELYAHLELPTASAILRIINLLADWEMQQNAYSLPMLVEKIIYESGIVAYLLQTTNHVWDLQVLNTFFDFLKESYNRNPQLKINNFLQIIDKMNDERISLPLQRVIQNENGVYFYTIHSSKGNEFEYVFLIGCTKNFWEDKKANINEFKLPDTLTATKEDVEVTYKIEVQRRLFYVALTRAKKYLKVSFAVNDKDGKSMFPSVFIEEISTIEERINKTNTVEVIMDQLQLSLQPIPEIKIKIANGAWVDNVLQQFALSASSLSKYLNCPLTFYYETILRVPFQTNDALAFGNAVHYALEKLFVEMKAREGTFPDKNNLINYFNIAMKREAAAFTVVQFERRMEQGITNLSEYYDYYISQFHKDVEIEFKIPKYFFNGIPITGKIDKIEFHHDGCAIIDYKTGDPSKYAATLVAGPNDKNPLGGDYWRQMVFYKLLLENYKERNWKVKMGMFDYVQKNNNGEYKQFVVPLYIQDEELVIEQMKTVYDKIMNHEFETGCGELDCRWCNFVKRYELINNIEE